jgi:replicative DNA helicase
MIESQMTLLYRAIQDVPPFQKEGKIKTGFSDLDRLLRIDVGDLVVIAGRTGEGKTALGVQTLYNNAKQGKPAGMISLEMTEGGIRKRLENSFGNLPNNFFISNPPALSTSRFRDICEALKGEQGVDLVLLDYLQMMREKEDYRSRHLEISHIIRRLKEIVKELDIALIAISQLSRQVDYRGGNSEPSLGDLKESGDIEYAADVVLFIHTPAKEKGEDTKLFLVDKNRWGPRGQVRVHWDGAKTRFKSY